MAKTRFIYKARRTNKTMNYTWNKEYYGEFITENYSNLLLIKNDLTDYVVVYKNDFDYVRKEIIKE